MINIQHECIIIHDGSTIHKLLSICSLELLASKHRNDITRNTPPQHYNHTAQVNDQDARIIHKPLSIISLAYLLLDTVNDNTTSA